MKFLRILLVLTTLCVGFPNEGEAGEELVKEYLNYKYDSLISLTNALLVGEMDTSLSAQEMVDHYVETADMLIEVFIAPTNGPGGYYNTEKNHIVISNEIKDKRLVSYILIHELTHAIQQAFNLVTYGRKSVIINELMADHIALAKTGLDMRQGIDVLSQYLDIKYLTEESFMVQVMTINNIREDLCE